MSAEANPVIGAMVHKDGKLQPIPGQDPSSQWTYRAVEDAAKESPAKRG
jgi:hypothetical protein